jgi:uncharacterized cupin superfamily protein
MKIVLDDRVRKTSLRADRAWEFFLESKRTLEGDRGLHGFTNWLWDELGTVAGNLNMDSEGEIVVTIPHLKSEALDFIVRLVSFWADEVCVKKKGISSGNLWRKPVVNVFEDKARKGAERALIGKLHEAGSTELNLMPLVGPGRGFFSVQVIERGDRTARMHSHSAVDEYYLILAGKGTLRYNGKEIEVGRGDFIAKPTGPDAATHFIADRGERLRILDMELWRERFTGTASTAKDLMFWPDFDEFQMRGPGWGAVVPAKSMITTKDFESYYNENYKRAKNGRRVQSKPPTRRRFTVRPTS